jgi:hypothetical protein
MPEKAQQWFHVWKGPAIDGVFETEVRAKKHGAWLHSIYQGSTWWRHKVTVTLNGEDIPFDDYEFKNGESRRVKRPQNQ